MLKIIENGLNCAGCPARHLRDIERIKHVEKLRLDALDGMNGSPNLILLGESPPQDRFIYDSDTEYSSNGLRFHLRQELVPGGNDRDLFEWMDDNGIWVVDAALCPLHRLETKKERRHAATICLKQHTVSYLSDFHNVPIFSIFPENCGFLKRELPALAKRISNRFSFSNLKGLKDLIQMTIPL